MFGTLYEWLYSNNNIDYSTLYDDVFINIDDDDYYDTYYEEYEQYEQYEPYDHTYYYI